MNSVGNGSRTRGSARRRKPGPGSGLALAGTRPIVNLSMMNFAADAWGQLAVQASNVRFQLANKVPCPVVFQIQYGSMGGHGTNHSACFHNWLANSPGMLVVIPSTPPTMP